MKKQLSILVVALLSFSSLAQPTISGFAPTSGPVGTTVVISGTNFNATPANNFVFFGSTKATVSAGSTTSLTVTVPGESTYQNISVTNTVTGLSAYSAKPFITTFTCGGVINTSVFGPKVDFTTGSSPFAVAIADVDGDGKSDLIVTNNASNTVSVFRNTSTVGTISYAAKVDLITGTGPQGLAVSDLDGDGKPEIAVGDNAASKVSVFRNTCTVGTISFAAKVDFTTGVNPSGITVGDLDGNGKAEIVSANSTANSVSVLRNTCTIGTISFAAKIDLTTGTGPFAVAVGDIDGDGKQEIAASNNGVSTVSVFRNTCTSGTISFTAKVDFTTGTNPYGVAIADLDGDGKPELAAANNNSASVSVLRNTSTSGVINAASLAAKVDFATGVIPYGLAIGDIDGDGKVDMATSNFNSTTTSLFKNTSTSGIISAASFATKVDFATGSQPFSIALGDLDGDNKTDIAVADFGAAKVSTFLNIMGGTSNMTSANTATVCSGVAVSISLTSNVASGYSWIASDNLNTSGESITTQTATTLNDVITNTTTPVQTIIYTVTPTPNTSSCPGTAQTVTITVNPAPVMTSIGSATICNGGSVNIPLTGSIPSTFNWIATNNPNTTGESITTQSTATLSNVITNTTAAIQNVIYTVTPASTTGSCAGVNQTVTVSVNPVPGMTSAGTATICSGTSVNLSFASNAPSTYTWIATDNLNTNGESITTQTTSVLNNTITSSSASVQLVIYTVTPTSTGGNCVGTSQTVSVSVNPLPVVTVNSATICSGQQVAVLTAGGASTYSWSPSAGLSATTGVNVSASPIPTSTYIVTGTDANNCKNTATAIVTVNPLPTLAVNAAPSSICIGGSSTLTVNGASTYTWAPASSLNNVNSASPTSTATSSTTYSVGGTDLNGCVNSATLAVTVNPLPTITANATSTVVCAGSNISLTGGGASTYTWTGGVSNGTPFAPSSSAVYTVTGTNSNGCIKTATVAITVNPLPTVTANAAPSASICFGSSVTLTGGGANTYAWSGGISNGVAFAPFITKTYTVTGTDANSCNSTTVITVTVNSPPSVTASATSTVVCQGTSTILNGNGASTYTWTGGVTNGVAFYPSGTGSYTVTGASIASCTNTATILINVNSVDTSITASGYTLTANANNATFQWMDCTSGLQVSGATNHIYTASSSGNYAAIVTQSGCVDTSSCYSITGVGVAQHNSYASITVYPNPNNGIFNLKASQFEPLKTNRIEIFNMMGEKIFSGKIQSENTQLDISNFANGIYQVKIVSGSIVIYQNKIVKQN